MNLSFVLEQEELVNHIVMALPKADWSTFALICSHSYQSIKKVPFYLLMNVMLQNVHFPPLTSYNLNPFLLSTFNFYSLFVKYTESDEDFNLDRFLLRVQYFWNQKLAPEQELFLMTLMKRFSWSLWLGLQHPLPCVKNASQLIQQIGYHISLCPHENWDKELLCLIESNPYLNLRMIPFYRISVHFPPLLTRKKITDVSVLLKLIPSNSKTMLLHFTDHNIWSQSKPIMLEITKYTYNLFYDNPMIVNPEFITNWTNDLEVMIEACSLDEKFITVASDSVKQNEQFRTIIVPKCYSLRSLNFIAKSNAFSAEFISNNICKNGFLLKFASQEQQENLEFVTKAVAQNGRAFEFASPSLRTNKELNLLALRISGLDVIKLILPEVIAKEVVLELAIFHRGKAMKPGWDATFIRSLFKIDTVEFALQVLQINIRFYSFLDSSMMRNETLVKYVACRKPHILITDSYKKENKQFQQWVIQSKEPFLRMLPNNGGINYKLIQAALKVKFSDILLLKGDKSMNTTLLKKIKKLFQQKWVPLEGTFVALEIIPPDLLAKDSELLNYLLQYCDMERFYKGLQNFGLNEEVLIRVAKQNLLALNWFPIFESKYKQDKLFMLRLIEEVSPYAFYLCHEELKQDLEIQDCFQRKNQFNTL